MAQRKWLSPIASGTYQSWRAMLSRCLNSKDIAYKYYGGRGVVIYPHWVDDYDQFYACMGERPEGLTLDRIDTDLGYGPTNCRWATMQEQADNKRRTVWITHQGLTMTMKEWAKKLGVPYYTLWNRIRCHGMSAEKALTNESLNRGRPL